MDDVSNVIRDVKNKSFEQKGIQTDKRESVFLLPMSDWHLYNKFRNGENVGGRIQFVWLFGIMGFFVLVLACINYVNLVTAKTDASAKEVAIRKTLGAARSELVLLFIKESVFLSAIALVISIIF